MKIKYRKIKAFTLIELLVVVAIIAILATIVMINVTGAREKSKISKAVALLTTVKKAAEMYQIDTHQWPATCRSGGTGGTLCSATNDPFLIAVSGVSGWNGPYIEGGIATMTHPWGGAVVYCNNESPYTDKQAIVLDDDKIGTGSGGSAAAIPDDSILKIDAILDDGNRDTGLIRQSTDGTSSGHIGEVGYLFASN